MRQESGQRRGGEDRMERPLTYLALVLIPAAAGLFRVNSEENSLVSEVGSDVLLPCTVSPPLSAKGLEVRWFHDQLHIVAFLLKDGREDRQQQNADYRGRTFLEGGPDSGNLSLILRKVRLSDAGRYHCFVENSTAEFFEEAILDLNVVGLGSPLLIAVGLHDSAVVVSCSSSGWFPEPRTVWRRKDGDAVPADLETQKDHANGLYTVQSRILLNASSEDQVYCGLRHAVTGKETGLYVTVSDAMFPRTSSWAIGFWLLFCVIIIASLVAVWFFVSKRKEKVRQLMIKDDCIERLRREIEWRKVSVRKESMLFDPLTAYWGLVVSPDGRNITTSDVAYHESQLPERFDTEPCVLTQAPISSGSHYWETEIREQNGKFWSVGIANQSVRRTGGQRECPESGIWAIRATDEGYLALSDPHEPITFSQYSVPGESSLLSDRGTYEPRRIQRVGTFLDYDNGKVSFYDVESYDHLYTFTHEFSEPVYGFYYVGTGISLRL
ncbi:butyrophilin subfamily 1 member A1-like [Pseudophryne corroboree]|uniref:butyrophilin subfamily 1 member A1-like n=1 Tax=Pseudophryne corroboree TaxID=495146 RepID=UPI003081BD98